MLVNIIFSCNVRCVKNDFTFPNLLGRLWGSLQFKIIYKRLQYLKSEILLGGGKYQEKLSMQPVNCHVEQNGSLHFQSGSKPIKKKDNRPKNGKYKA